MESKLEQQYQTLKQQAKELMKLGNLKAYIEKLIEAEQMKQHLLMG